jgi:hypothetical protein
MIVYLLRSKKCNYGLKMFKIIDSLNINWCISSTVTHLNSQIKEFHSRATTGLQINSFCIRNVRAANWTVWVSFVPLFKTFHARWSVTTIQCNLNWGAHTDSAQKSFRFRESTSRSSLLLFFVKSLIHFFFICLPLKVHTTYSNVTSDKMMKTDLTSQHLGKREKIRNASDKGAKTEHVTPDLDTDHCYIVSLSDSQLSHLPLTTIQSSRVTQFTWPRLVMTSP